MRRGFTLTELLIVIGIMIMLMAILLPAVMRAINQGDKSRTMADLRTVAVALAAYRDDFSDFPRSTNPANVKGSQVLVHALIAPYAADPRTAATGDDFVTDFYDGADGAGFRARRMGLTAQGRVYGPYLKPDSFKFTDTQIQDRAGLAVLYFPAMPVRPAILSGANRFVDSAGTAYYDARYAEAGTLTLASMKAALGDKNGDGGIGAGETALTLDPFILWAAGPDGQYGSKDDVIHE